MEIALNAKIVPLGEIATVRTIKTFRDRAPQQDDKGNAGVLSIRDLTGDWPGTLNNLMRVHLDPEEMSHCLRIDEILMPARGDKYPARIFTGILGKVISAGQISVIKSGPGVSPGYLAWHLNDAETQAILMRHLNGTGIRSLTKANLLSIPIQVPAMALQLDIAELHGLQLARRSSKLELIEVEDRLVAEKCRRMAKGRQ
jgi:hypothetical protein